MDDRPFPERGERVWMPDAIDAMIQPPGRLLTATIEEVDDGYVMIKFDRGQGVELGGTSGTPVISQRTGNVIGMISREGEVRGDTHALLTKSFL